MSDVAAFDAADVRANLAWDLTVVVRALASRAEVGISDIPGRGRGYLVLSALARENARSQLSLAKQLGVDRTVMTYLIDDLETAGMVARRADPNDRRVRQVVLTEQGERVLARALVVGQEAESWTLLPLSVDESKSLREMIDRVARHVLASGSLTSNDDAAP